MPKKDLVRRIDLRPGTYAGGGAGSEAGAGTSVPPPVVTTRETGFGQAFFEMYGAVTTGTVPGPTNITGRALLINRVWVRSDGQVAGSVTAGGSFSFIAGGGWWDMDSLGYVWSDGAALSMIIDSVGVDATYLCADVYFTVV